MADTRDMEASSHPIPDPAEQRREARMVPHGVGSTAGKVVDMSLGGMQLLVEGCYEGSAGEHVMVVLHTDETQLSLGGRVAWHEVLPGRRYVLGVAFTALEPATQAELENLVRQTCSGYDASMSFVAA